MSATQTQTRATLPEGWCGGARVWVVDTEFSAPDGHRPHPWCVVLRDARTHQELRVWVEDLQAPPPCPYDPEHDVLVTYFGSAEHTVFRVLQWPYPKRHIDLHAELRVLHGTQPPPSSRGWGLVSMCTAYGVPFMDVSQKETFRDIAINGPQTAADCDTLLDYCAADVEATHALLCKVAPRIGADPRALAQALLRGEYVAGVADMQHTGTPVDAATWSRLVQHWPQVLETQTTELVQHWPVFVRNKKGAWGLNVAAWSRVMQERGIPWPTTSTGRPCTDADTIKDMARAHPVLRDLQEFMVTRGLFKLGPTLHIGPDARNRCLLGQFRSTTGRNQPSNSAFIFGPSTWVRGLIQAPPGRCLIYSDLAGAEIGLAAALSGDTTLAADYASGDPYTHFGRAADIMPRTGTKQTHPQERDLAKRFMLSAGYGAGVRKLSALLGVPERSARELVTTHKRRYATYWEYSAGCANTVSAGMPLHTPLGWRFVAPRDSKGLPDINPRSVSNFPMQAACADVLRVAVVLARRRGIEVCAPVHDALLVEGADSAAEELAAAIVSVWRDASRVVLRGTVLEELRSDATIVRAGCRYMDGRGAQTWKHIMGILDTVTQITQ